MPTEAQMKNAMQSYIDAFNRNDLDAVVALYSDDATVEDPYGTPAKSGKVQIEAFYRASMAYGSVLRLSAPIRASHGDAAAMAFDAVVTTPQGEGRVKVIDVMTFTEEGLINSMRAYFGPGDIEMPELT
ncbi:steroid delta-isomerase [Pseudomonas laurylsulfativorans]|uniref:Steroid delta-isomerase n=1 Tax=Pseudomonas laurylsulfativorans TaxID=1943631 RepID=A0A2S3VR95_9PSED|nr:nuclear transport factor 2 family protein [Pseudomonas laurylsulfativorans]POF42383.1 steroid delta-isomerase [Pseudomonas laurylsulfativorans]